MTVPPPDADGNGPLIHPATLPEEVKTAALTLREKIVDNSATSDHLHALLTNTFTPFTPDVARDGHPVAWFCHLSLRTPQGVFSDLRAVSNLAVALIHAIRLAAWHELLKRNPGTEEARSEILKMVKIK